MPFFYLSLKNSKACSAVDFITQDQATFLSWLNQAIMTFQKVPIQNINEVLEGNTARDLFPTYQNTEKSRKLIKQLSQQVKDKEAPERQSLKRIYNSAIRGNIETLNTEQQNFLELVKHIVYSHINQYSHLVNGRFSQFTASMKEHEDLLSPAIIKDRQRINTPTTPAESLVNKAFSADEELIVTIIKGHIQNENCTLMPLIIEKLDRNQIKIKVLDALFTEFKARFEDPNRIPSEFDSILGTELAKLINWAMKNKVFVVAKINIASDAANFTDELLERSNTGQKELAENLTKIIDGK